jgi:DNA-binding NarL/FixJ family response regulator
VIGLASVSSAEIQDDLELPEALYRFFAEEIFDALGPEVRAHVATLATLPLLDRELVAELIAEEAERVLTTALDVGVLVERGPRLEIHPLARSFLEERSEQLNLVPDPGAAAIALAHYRKRRDWDAAFELIVRRGLVEELEPLLCDALDELLETARLQTIENWYKVALEAGLDSPLFSIARAELSLRQGRHAEAQTYAEAAALPQSPYAFRALSVAGRAAHLASREEEALELYNRAEERAVSDSERRDARWGRLVCLIDLERDDAEDALDELLEGVSASDPRDYVRAATCKLFYQVRSSALDLEEAEVAWRMRVACTDPLVRASFENAYSHSLAMTARYQEALAATEEFLATARRYRLDFALPYGLCTIALASAGTRNWPRAHESLAGALQLAAASRNVYAELCVYAVRIRTLAQQGRAHLALSLPVPEFKASLKSMRAEVLTSRALVLASVDRLDEASAALRDVEGLSGGVEQTVLSQAAAAIIALKRHDQSAIELAAQFEDTAFSKGALDLLVTAYRVAPELLSVLLRASPTPGRTAELVRRVGDEDLAQALGESVALVDEPLVKLTKREREVYELVSAGLANREIAELLVISESTVKLHVHHIYDKLGVRSRAAVVIQAALRRSDQATSATLDSGTTGSS